MKLTKEILGKCDNIPSCTTTAWLGNHDTIYTAQQLNDLVVNILPEIGEIIY